MKNRCKYRDAKHFAELQAKHEEYPKQMRMDSFHREATLELLRLM